MPVKFAAKSIGDELAIDGHGSEGELEGEKRQTATIYSLVYSHGDGLILRGGRHGAIVPVVDIMERTGDDEGSEKRNPSADMDAEDHGCFFERAGDYIRRGAPTDTECAQGEDGETSRQIRLLFEWATQAGCLIPPKKLRELDQISDRTSEHKVYYDPERRRAIKQTLLGQFGWKLKLDNGRWTLGIATPLNYLNRWQLFNRVFGDDVQLEGVTLSGEPSMIIGNTTKPISVVVSQRWHRAADTNSPIPTETQIATLLSNLGFEPLQNSFHGWKRASDGLVILDARPDNFVKTKEGIVPIDLPMVQAAG